MNILALDTSTTTCLVALLTPNQHHFLHETGFKQQGRLILPLIEKCLNLGNLGLHDLNGLAYCHGPGSFTGIRIANSVVQGISFAKKIPIVPLSSLQIKAQAAFLCEQKNSILVAINAEMEQIYWANYELSADGIMQLKGQENCGQKGDIPKDSLEKNYSFAVLARSLVTLAAYHFKTRRGMNAEEVSPLYLRGPNVKNKVEIL